METFLKPSQAALPLALALVGLAIALWFRARINSRSAQTLTLIQPRRQETLILIIGIACVIAGVLWIGKAIAP